MKNRKFAIAGVVAMVLGVVVIGVLLSARGGGAGNSVDKVTVQKDGKTLTVNRDGHVSYEDNGNTYEDVWSEEKTSAFFSYFSKNYSGEGDLVTGGANSVTISSGSGSTTYVLSPGDEITDAAANDVVSGGGGGGGGGGGISDIINNSPTPSPAPTSTSGGVVNPGGPDPECLYWKLSYCVRKRTPAPTPVPTSSPDIRQPDCSANTQTGKTVIGNDLCLPTPSPTPTP